MKKKRRKSSIKYQIAFVSVIMITLTILSCWIVNNFFLEKFYQASKKDKLMEVYNLIQNGVTEGNIGDNDFLYSLKDFTDSENISVFILNERIELVLTTEHIDNMTMFQLTESIYNMYGDVIKNSNTEIIEKTGDYTISIIEDDRLHSKYMQITAIVGSENFLVARTAIQSFKENAIISNRFLAYVGGIGIIFSCCIVWFVSGRITKPINELVKISDKMAALDFDAKYKGNDNNELGILGNRMNFLSDTLETTISDLKKANRDLQIEIDKKEKIDVMRRDFLSNVSHELKTPIALIQGYSEGLKECVNDDDESKDFYCDVIIDEANKMNTLVQKLLTLNKIEFGDIDNRIERIDITELLNNVISSVTLLSDQKNAKIIKNYENGLFAWGDQFEIQQIVTNYLSNAINHVSGELLIDIKAKKLAEDKLCISVFNTGTPIPEDELDNIWQKFYKVDKAHTREYGGSGIGLSIVKAIVDAMGQEYGVKNYDNGVEFWFTLDAKNI